MLRLNGSWESPAQVIVSGFFLAFILMGHGLRRPEPYGGGRFDGSNGFTRIFFLDTCLPTKVVSLINGNARLSELEFMRFEDDRRLAIVRKKTSPYNHHFLT